MSRSPSSDGFNSDVQWRARPESRRCFAHENAALIPVYTRVEWQSSMSRARLTSPLFLAGGIFKIRITLSRLRLGAQPVDVIGAQVRVNDRVAREVPVADINATCDRQV